MKALAFHISRESYSRKVLLISELSGIVCLLKGVIEE
jgi:hypothetical protein